MQSRKTKISGKAVSTVARRLDSLRMKHRDWENHTASIEVYLGGHQPNQSHQVTFRSRISRKIHLIKMKTHICRGLVVQPHLIEIWEQASVKAIRKTLKAKPMSFRSQEIILIIDPRICTRDLNRRAIKHLQLISKNTNALRRTFKSFLITSNTQTRLKKWFYSSNRKPPSALSTHFQRKSASKMLRQRSSCGA